MSHRPRPTAVGPWPGSAHEEKQVGEMLTKTFDPGEVIFREGNESQVSFLQDG